MKTMGNMLTVVTVLAIAGSVSAATVNWTDAGADNLWTNAANWSTAVPTGSDDAIIDDGGEGALVVASYYETGEGLARTNDWAQSVFIGSVNSGSLTLDDGALRIYNNIRIGHNAGSTGTVTIVSGDGTFDGWRSLQSWTFTLADAGGHATLINNGGTIKVWSEWFNIAAWGEPATAHVQLNGGTILSEGIHMGSGGSIDLAGGTLAVAGDLSNDPSWGDLFAEWVASGQLTAYGVSNEVSRFEFDYNTINPGYTTISAVPPVQSPLELYMEWAAGAGLDTNGSNSAATFDVEPDGMNNLLEYALDGNPLVDDAASIQPTSELIDADTWEYVYNRRLDATFRGLSYDIVAKENLVAPVWTHSGGSWETNSTPIDAFFESVTNVIPNSAGQGFIKLEVEASF